MEKYNILLITPCLNIGGEELSTIAVAEELIKRGHNVYYMSSDGPLLKELVNKRINFSNGRMNAKNIFGFKKGIEDIKNIVKKCKIDIIHCSDPHTTTMSYFAVKFYRLKNKIIWHDRRTRFYPITTRIMNIVADFVIANSNFEKQKLIKNGLNCKKIKTIHNSLNIPFPKKKSLSTHNTHRPQICTVGRLVPIKGHKYFVKAAAEIRKEKYKVKFLIVGDGFLRTKLQDFVVKKNMEKDVIFTGFKRNLEELYSSIDILVNPSLYESFGNTCLEAMAYGKPVIATKTGGVPEVIEDGVTGILVPPRNFKKMAEAVIYLLKNPNITQKMGKAGREKAKKYFTINRVGNEIEGVYKNVMENTQ